jgi:hypothetical protein
LCRQAATLDAIDEAYIQPPGVSLCFHPKWHVPLVTEAMAEWAISSFNRAGEDQGPDHVSSFSFEVLCAKFQGQVVIFQILKVMFVICTSTSTAWY